mmetsp:Transcript_76188/g.153048  ORF Transcript_76188/g.153048 Transcript_76188/m.153048 type:complete len:338 (-) Transcript_76188:203-1216(-)
MVVWQIAALAPLFAWVASRRLFVRAPRESWTSFTLPEQALWTGIQSYQRHPTLPVLTFATESAGLGDPATLAEIAHRYVPRPTDVHIVTYPKAGTSWIQEVVWLVNHEADIPTSKKVPSSERTVYIELRTPRTDKLSHLAVLASPRHIKWHHSSPLLPKLVVDKGRVIYLLRNPKDTVVSWYYFQRMNALYGFTGDFDAFFELFLRGDVAYGCYWHNVLSWWRLRHRANVLLLTYEEMHADLPAVVLQVAAFLGKDLTAMQVAAIAEHCQFQRMKRNPATNAALMPKVAGETDFMRKGQVGDWRNHLSEEQSRRMDAWIDENVGDERLPLVYDPVSS